MSDDDWRAAVDDGLIARCEAHVAHGQRLTRDWSMAERAPPPRSHLEPADWRTGFLRADREREIPYQLNNDLHENMPQALLRDLYRPVHESRWVERAIVEGSERGSPNAMREVRQARTLPELPRVESGLRAVLEHQSWRRALMAAPWHEARPEKPAK